jgi:hypothetical protein
MVATVACAQEGAVIRRRNVRFGSKADMCGAAAYVRPDMCSAARDVRKQKDRLHNGPSENPIRCFDTRTTGFLCFPLVDNNRF